MKRTLAIGGAAVVVVFAWLLGTRSADECIARPSKTVLVGTSTSQFSLPSPPDDHTIDAREYTNLGYPARARRVMEIGADRPANSGLCVVGGTVIGQQSTTLTWRQMHDDIEGSALRISGQGYVVDGLRASNVEDGFDPRGGEGFTVRNTWMTYIRDDCIENDERRAGVVEDSLFDGCYTFFSEQESGSVAGEELIFDRVLVRLDPMPGPYGTIDPSILGHGKFFKSFDYGGRHAPIIRDSIFVAEKFWNGADDWPPGTVASNVTIVWLGEGEFPMTVLPGMTLTRDRSVWDRARAVWLARHGCSSFGNCTRLYHPEP
jgi:hypothetical protein